MFKKYFAGSTWFSVVCLILATVFGYEAGGASGAIAGAASAFAISLMLGMMEVSLSFDNAVINAKVLAGMDAVWRKRFIVWGIPIAVFGMRFLFPLVIVDVVTPLNLLEVGKLAFTNPERYSEYLHGAHYMISAFGFGFLSMVAFGWFIDPDKESHWFDGLERAAQRLHILKFAPTILSASLLFMMGIFIPIEHWRESIIAGIVGIIAQYTIHALASRFNAPEAGQVVARAGLMSFIYLEVLDASFSLDGVIGAFAITKEVPIIMAGLAIGAIYVRSLTLMLVDRGTLAEYKYLEHGAHYGILALAIIMLVSLSPAVHIPEVLTGLIGVGFIVAAVWNSISSKKNEGQHVPG